MKNRITRWALVVALGIIGTAIYVPSAQASLRAIDAQCGAHLGKLISRNQVGNIYHVRLGVKHYGGSHQCHGRWASRSRHKAPDGGLSINWHPFTLPSFSFSGAANVTRDTLETSGMCAASGIAFSAELPTASLSTIVALGAGAGCVDGVLKLGFRFHNSIYPVRR